MSVLCVLLGPRSPMMFLRSVRPVEKPASSLGNVIKEDSSVQDGHAKIGVVVSSENSCPGAVDAESSKDLAVAVLANRYPKKKRGPAKVRGKSGMGSKSFLDRSGDVNSHKKSFDVSHQVSVSL